MSTDVNDEQLVAENHSGDSITIHHASVYADWQNIQKNLERDMPASTALFVSVPGETAPRQIGIVVTSFVRLNMQMISFYCMFEEKMYFGVIDLSTRTGFLEPRTP